MDSDQGVIRRFKRGSASAKELQAVVDETLADLGAESELKDVEVTVSEEGQGTDATGIAIVVGILTGGGTRVLTSIWDDVLWPRIKRRLGIDAVGEELPR